MKHLFSYLFSLLLLGSIFIGCSDQQAPTAGTDNNEPVLMKPGGGGGAFVEKYQGEAYFTFIDPDAELKLLLGVDVSDCPDGNQIDVLDFMDVWLPNSTWEEVERLVAKTRAHNVYAQVWEWTFGIGPAPGGNCNYYSTHTPIATGTANLRNTDNDVLAGLRWWLGLDPENNANAFGWKANGTLMGQDDQVFKLNFVWRGVWHPKPDTFMEHYKIQLTPTGGN